MTAMKFVNGMTFNDNFYGCLVWNKHFPSGFWVGLTRRGIHVHPGLVSTYLSNHGQYLGCMGMSA